jgi:hypothetical protein
LIPNRYSSGDKSLNDSSSSPQSIPSVTSSDTLVHDLEEERGHVATAEEIVDKEIPIGKKDCPPSPANSTTKIPQGNLHAKLSSDGVIVSVEGGEHKSFADNDKKTEILPLPVYESRFGALPSCLRELFGHRDKFLHDCESQTLEAFLVHGDPETMLKLPFGHQRLTFGLKRMLKKNKGLSWDQYLSLDSQHQRVINRTVISAKQMDSRCRTCLAIDIYKEPGLDAERMLVFFSLGAPVEPVRLTDCVGRKFSFPFEQCRTGR